MARKKKSVEETTEKTILRNYDIYSLENRVHAMDKKIQRSYDIYSLEKRIHDLEKGGTTPTPPTPTPTATDIIKRVVGDSDAGTATIKYTGKYVIWLVLDSSYIDSYNFKINNVDATSALASGVLTHVNISEGFGYTHIEVELTKDDILTWNVRYSNRYFIMFNKVEE